MSEPKIVSSFWAKPIPIRCFDWEATLEGYDGAPDAGIVGNWIGHGETEMDAIEDLQEQIADYDEENPPDERDWCGSPSSGA